jgi:hypothetical protein
VVQWLGRKRGRREGEGKGGDREDPGCAAPSLATAASGGGGGGRRELTAGG